MRATASRTINHSRLRTYLLLSLCLLLSNVIWGQGFADWELDGALAATRDPDPHVLAKALRFLSERGGPPDRTRAALERNELLRSILTGKAGKENLALIMPEVSDLKLPVFEPQFRQLAHGNDDTRNSLAVRAFAVRALGKLDRIAPETANLLGDLLTSDDLLRKIVLATLHDLGPRAAPLLPRLDSLLREDSKPHRLTALTAIADIGPAASALASHVKDFLTSPDPEIREAALAALEWLGKSSASFGADIRARLSDSAPEVRKRAIRRRGVPTGVDLSWRDRHLCRRPQ
jgi:HEAT repeat protein